MVSASFSFGTLPIPSSRGGSRQLESSKTKYLQKLEELSRRQASLQKKLKSEHQSFEVLNEIEEQVHARGWLAATGRQLLTATLRRKLPPLHHARQQMQSYTGADNEHLAMQSNPKSRFGDNEQKNQDVPNNDACLTQRTHFKKKGKEALAQPSADPKRYTP